MGSILTQGMNTTWTSPHSYCPLPAAAGVAGVALDACGARDAGAVRGGARGARAHLPQRAAQAPQAGQVRVIHLTLAC